MTKSFTEFEVYQKSLLLAKEIFVLMNNPAFEREYGFKDQIKRAVVSISNNIAEGSEYNNNKQFIRFLRHSKGSCAEVRSMLILSNQLNLCSQQDTIKPIELSIEISKNLSKFIEYLKSRV
ncbi:four helix bundle protein [Flavobacterium subsaxonicum]|uniref:30S ribosomal protein S23 n=1 Tax=Flavobacterium subsaxonicum WB 4.1-42 = DSM 21790 TaxID=1121898 RepID=A0A0A2MKG3_9FLAO|nr:four helix bundle protein [Flavobacterium subsaxonicum]KGO92769.1 30S ribosomal protein S23 [Flavobacterium subsaxonicum WB 4.1-42 = DSM 21790]